MYKYIFNTKGQYVAFIYDEIYCFTADNDYIGFLNQAKLYDYNGKFLGELTGDDRIVRNITMDYEDIEPIEPPKKVTLPPEPKRRLRMSRLPRTYIDVFKNYERNKVPINIVDIVKKTSLEEVVIAMQMDSVRKSKILKQKSEINEKLKKNLKAKKV